MFDLAERVLALNSGNNNNAAGNGNGAGEDEAGGALDPDRDGDVADYVYVDDAVDAILAAMQYRPPPDASSGAPPPGGVQRRIRQGHVDAGAEGRDV